MRKLLPLLFSITIIFQLSQSAYSQDRKSILSILQKQVRKLGIPRSELDRATITRSYTDEKTRITYVYLQQTFRGIDVYNSILSIAIRDSAVAYASGRFVKGVETMAGHPQIRVQPIDAVHKAADHLKLKSKGDLTILQDRFLAEKKYIISPDGLSKRDIEVKQYWIPSDDKKKVSLSWNVKIDDLHSDDAWQVTVDATSGEVTQKFNGTIYEQLAPSIDDCNTTLKSEELAWDWPSSHSIGSIKKMESPLVSNTPAPFAPVTATYQVIPYPGESPAVLSADIRTNPWEVFGVGNPATTLGWHTTFGTDYRITRGNNTFTYLGTQPTDLPNALYNWPDTSIGNLANLFFLQIPDYNYQPNDSVHLMNKKFALDNLFYWNNMLHDMTYQYGFNEPAGNFQYDNFGRGGFGGDGVRSQAQDGHGYSNANFSAYQDGVPGYMRMYLWPTGRAEFTIEENSGTVQYPARDNLMDAQNELWRTGARHGEVVLYNDDAAGTTHHGCVPPANDLAGKIAMIDMEGVFSCNDFSIPAKFAENAGAIGMIIFSLDENLYGLGGGIDTAVHIPVTIVQQSTGIHIMYRLTIGETVNVSMSAAFRDATLDNGVISHEYMHGVTIRLTGAGYGCLFNGEQAGEGWSDYLSLMMTTNWANTTIADMNTPHYMGSYASSNPNGVRRIPYTPDMTLNPITYAHMPVSSNEHYRGEIWCSTLWDMTWNIIQQTGTISPTFLNNTGDGGNVIAMNLVMTALKLQPCYPGFLDARDAILAADSILYNKQFNCAIWSAFARRGMGYTATQGNSNNTLDQAPAFGMPMNIMGMKDSVVYSGAAITVTHTITPSCQAITGYALRDTIPKGFTYVSSSPQGMLLFDSVLVFPPIDIAVNQSKQFSLTLTASGPGCTPDTVLRDNGEVGSPFIATSSTDPVEAWQRGPGGRSGNAWKVPDQEFFSINYLTSPPSSGNAIKNVSLFSFWHSWFTEDGYDGGVVQYTAGGPWKDAAPLFIKNPPTTHMVNPDFLLETPNAFSGDQDEFVMSTIDLSSFGTTPVYLRFKFMTDLLVGADGWIVDDIIRVNSCGGKLKTGLWNNGSTSLEGQSNLLLQILPQAVLPLSLVSFEAEMAGPRDVLDWETASEVNVKEFEVQHSTDNRQWTTLSILQAKNGLTNEYSYSNNSPTLGANYYRLKMKDIDGQFTYSPVRILRRKSSAELFTLLPNPARQTANFYFSKDLDVSGLIIYDGTGRIVKQIRMARGSLSYQADISNLATGVYFAEAVTTHGKHVIRFIKE